MTYICSICRKEYGRKKKDVDEGWIEIPKDDGGACDKCLAP